MKIYKQVIIAVAVIALGALSVAPVQAQTSSRNTTVIAPSNLDAANSYPYSGTVLLTWRDNSNNEPGFRLQRSVDGRNWTTIADLDRNETFFIDYAPGVGKTYYYRVRAFNIVQSNSYVYSPVVSVRISNSYGR